METIYPPLWPPIAHWVHAWRVQVKIIEAGKLSIVHHYHQMQKQIIAWVKDNLLCIEYMLHTLMNPVIDQRGQ